MKLGHLPIYLHGQSQIIPYSNLWANEIETTRMRSTKQFRRRTVEKKGIGPAHEYIMEVDGEKEKKKRFS